MPRTFGSAPPVFYQRGDARYIRSVVIGVRRRDMMDTKTNALYSDRKQK